MVDRPEAEDAMTQRGRTGEKPGRNQRLLAGGAILAIVGALGLTYWTVRTEEKPVRPVTRTLADFDMEWRCLACGNTLRDKGSPDPKECPKCHKREMYMTSRWSCPQHGPQRVAYQYDSEGNATRVKVGDGPWQPATIEDGPEEERGGSNVRCPVCRALLLPPG